MKEAFEVPILIICYNRSQYIREQVKQIKKVKPVKIFIACDGPKNEEDVVKVNNVRNLYLDLIDWDCEIQTNFRDENLGCYKGVKGALEWFYSINERGIIIEDDIIPTTDFFFFMEVMLDYYKNDKNIFCVSGCNLGYDSKDIIFGSKIMNMWGWATWSDRFSEVDFSISSWQYVQNKKLYLYKRLRSDLFDYDHNWINYWIDIFNRAVNNENFSTWDYQLIYNQLVKEKLAIFPGVNLIKNLGFEQDATHTTAENHVAKNLPVYELNWPIEIPKEIKVDKNFYNKYLKELWAYYKRPNLKYYVGNYLKKIGFDI